MNMHKCCHCIPPEAEGQTCLIEYSGDPLCKCPVGSLCNSILMRFISDSMLSVNSCSLTELLPLIGHVFSSLIIPSGFDLCTKLVLSKCLELLECTKCITLLPKWRDSPEPAIIINKDDPVLVAMSGLDREWAMKVRVDQLKWSSCSVRCKFGDIGPVLLACNAGLTDRIWSSIGLDHHPLH